MVSPSFQRMSLLESSPDIVRDSDLTALSSFRTPAKTRYFFEVSSEGNFPVLSEAVAECQENGLPVLFLSSGTNVLFAFDLFPGLVVRNALSGVTFEDADTVSAASGESIHVLALAHRKAFGSGALTPWIGLPGTVAGAVVGNAGCFGLETADILESARVWDFPTGRVETVPSERMGYAYRSSVLKNDASKFVLSARFDLRKRESGNAYESMDIEAFRELRRSKQPAGRTCGSFFKNPPGASAGALIDRAGLKGAKVGGVEISRIHANFFIAQPGASWRDVLALRDLVRERVEAEAGTRLEEEVRIVTPEG